MVTKSKRPASSPSIKRLAAHKRATSPSVAEPAPSIAAEPSKPNLLRAGLKALGNVRNDVVQQQSRVFEAILGIDPAQGWSGLMKRDGAQNRPVQEAVGLRKFEAVFDQRVANALERIGMPSMKSVKALEKEVAALRDEVADLRSQLRARADAKRSSGKTEPRTGTASRRKP